MPKKKGSLVGKHFYASWGYDQTNIDYVKVVGQSKTGKTVTARMAKQKLVRSTGTGQDYVAPSEPHGKPFKLRVQTDYTMYGKKHKLSEMQLRGSYPYAGEGSKRLGSFYKYKGEPKYQTSQGWGH